jgi:SAM-dependent methyltransferase
MYDLEFPDSFLFKTGERIIPGSVSSEVLSRHYARYVFAADFCQDAVVLNAASGSGYGSEVLLTKARDVYNVDISEQLVAYGNRRYGAHNNHFLTMDVQRLIFPDRFFDVIVSLETIEHVPDAATFLSHCARVLKDDGVLIVSSPNRIMTSPFSSVPVNRFHVKEWDFDEFCEFTKDKFNLQGTYGQALVPQRQAAQTRSLLARQRLTEALPGPVFRFIKQNIRHYKDIPWNQVTILDIDVVQSAERDRFFPTPGQPAYEVIIFVLKKRPRAS